MIVDRLAVKPTVKQRLTDSVETALGLAQGVVSIDFVDLDPKDPLRERRYSEKMACPNDHDIAIDELEPRQFSFNGPWGACPECSGLGTRMEVDPELVVPDDEKSLSEGAIAPWASAHVADYFQPADRRAGRERRLQHRRCRGTGCRPPRRRCCCTACPGQVHVRYRNRYGRERSYNAKYEGVVSYIERRHAEAETDTSRERFAGYMREVPCHACHGARLKPTSLAVTVGGKNIAEIAGHVDRRGGRLPPPAGAHRPRAADRRAGAQGDQRAAQVPARRRPGLPVAEPADRQPVRR